MCDCRTNSQISSQTTTLDLQTLLEKNKHWAATVSSEQPAFFSRLLKQQNPQFLWIGCSDSRVPANVMLEMEPGEIFVHRNIANIVAPSDLNCLSVIQFAVEQLKVKHIMVVGHTLCSGVRAALLKKRVGLADSWLRYVQDVADRHKEFLEQIKDSTIKHNALCELNALEQALHVCQTVTVMDAWAAGQEIHVHALVYALDNGVMKDLHFSVSAHEQIQPAYERALQLFAQRYAL